MKTARITIIIAVIGVALLGYAMFGMGFEIGSNSNSMSDNDIECLKQYGMTCDQYTAEQLKIKSSP